MNEHSFSSPKVEQSRQSEPRKLHKPHRDLGDRRPEQVIPYVDDGPCDTGSTDG